MKYIRYILTLVIAIAFTVPVWAQQERQEMPDRNAMGKFAIKKVDFDHIHEVISNPKNTYYYPKLMKAYNSSDTTLSIEAWSAPSPPETSVRSRWKHATATWSDERS